MRRLFAVVGLTLAGLLPCAAAEPPLLVAEAKEKEILTDVKGAGVAAFSPDGKSLATADAKNIVHVWDAKTGKEQLTLGGHTGAVLTVVLPPSDGEWPVTGGADGVVISWPQESGKVFTLEKSRWYRDLEKQKRLPRSLAYSPDGKFLLVGYDDSSVQLLKANTGEHISSTTCNTLAVSALAFTPDGKLFATGNEDGHVSTWDPATGAEIRKIGKHLKAVRAVAFSPDGKMLASVGDDAMVRLWDVATGKALQTIEGHKGTIHAVAFSPDGKTMASAGADQLVRVWDMATGEPVLRLNSTLDHFGAQAAGARAWSSRERKGRASFSKTGL